MNEHYRRPTPPGGLPALWLLLCLAWLLGGCASKALVYPEVIPPEAVRIAPLKFSDRPVIALALGGGAARGFTHIGVIKVLEANGIHPDIVVGTSAGSFVGALYAGGYDGAALERLAIEMNEDEVRDLVFPDRGFVKGERLQDYINQKLHNRSIEELPIRYATVATDLGNGTLAVFTRGNTGMAVRASSSVPGVFQPVKIGEHEYVDGGMLSPVPVKVARDQGADLVIAVDIARRPEDTPALTGTAGIVAQSLSIMTKQLARHELEQADIRIQPDTRDLVSIDFSTRMDAIEEGIKAAQAVIGQVLDWLAQHSCRTLATLTGSCQKIVGGA